MPRPPAKTQRMTVYQLRNWGTADELIQNKYIRQDFQVNEIEVDGEPGWLIAGSLPSTRARWCTLVEGLTTRELDLCNQTSAAALLLQAKGKSFAVTFGMGWQLLDPSQVEQGFGLRFAIRALDPDDIREVARRTLDSRARIDRSTVPGGQRIRLYAIEEYGEIVSRIVGKARVDQLTHADGQALTFSVTGSDALKLPLARTAPEFIADLRVVADVLDQKAPDPDLEFIDKVQPLRQKDPRRKRLDTRLSAAFEGTGLEVGLALSYPWEGEAEFAEAESYIVRRGAGETLISGDIDISDLLETVENIPADRKLAALYNTRIQPCAGPDGDEVIGRAVSGDKWIVAELSLGGERFFLHQGKWYEIGQSYTEFLKSRVEQILAPGSNPVTLPPWPSGLIEGKYNEKVAQDSPSEYICFDKNLLRTKMHPRGFEVADLLGPNNELIHIKRTTSRKGSAPLHHLFAQGCNAAEQLAYNKDARQRLVEEIRKVPGRKVEDEFRPNRIVFGISLEGRELSPDTLFTFAKIGMVRSVERIERSGGTVEVVSIPTSARSGS